MNGIHHDIVINASPDKIFDAITTAEGLELWWTKQSRGKRGIGERMQFYFSVEYDWEAEIVEMEVPTFVEWKMTRAMADWMPTRLRFELLKVDSDATMLRFSHTGWEKVDEHFRRSSYCWALYLRLLKRYIELGEIIPYEIRTSS